jgi:hypothetical protein
MTNTKLLFLCIIITQSIFQDTQSQLIANVINIKYPGNSPGCSASTTVSVSTLNDCRMACLNHAGCRTVTFDPNSNQCGLFSAIPSQSCQKLQQPGVVTTTAIGNNQLSTGKSKNNMVFISDDIKAHRVQELLNPDPIN